MNKYRPGDAVKVVHRLKGEYYYSHRLEGSVGIVDHVQSRNDGAVIYHLNYLFLNDDRLDDPKNAQDYAHHAWYRENCLEPATDMDIPREVTDKEFEGIFE